MGLFDIFRKKPKSLLDALNENPLFKQQKELYDAMSLMCQDGVDADDMPNVHGEFGMTPSNTIPCNTVFGSTSYLARLRATDGAKVVYNRIGSFGSDVTPHPVDGYEISHPNGQKLATLYISPYQQRISNSTTKRFTITSTPMS